jgi:hypothetical protein
MQVALLPPTPPCREGADRRSNLIQGWIPTGDTIVWISAVRETEDHPLKAIVLFSCAGLIGSLCLTMFGIDLGAGWI